jgi:hypothetical protein
MGEEQTTRTTRTTATELRTLAGRVGSMTIGEAEAACALASEATGYGMHMRGSSLIAAVIRHLLDAADSLESREALAQYERAKAADQVAA